MLLFCSLGREIISELETEKIGDDDKDFQYCIAEIKRRMEVIGPAKLSNEAMRCSILNLGL